MGFKKCIAFFVVVLLNSNVATMQTIDKHFAFLDIYLIQQILSSYKSKKIFNMFSVLSSDKYKSKHTYVK